MPLRHVMMQARAVYQMRVPNTQVNVNVRASGGRKPLTTRTLSTPGLR